jgi:aspartate carbamoyltransferase
MSMALTLSEFTEALEVSSRRRALLMRDGRPCFVLMSQQFDVAELDKLFDVATAIRRLDRHRDGRVVLRGLLHGVRVMNLFAQPSTRTAESFIAAADKLGASTRLVTDLRTSSFAKGETVEDSVRTLASFFDAIVARHPDDDFAVRASWALWRGPRKIPVVSAGSGKSQHPTQSLLDAYTLRHAWAEQGGLAGKRVLVIGDVARNRAARSLAYILAKFPVGRIDFVSQGQYKPDDGLLSYLGEHGVQWEILSDLHETIAKRGKDYDALYVTRLQQEWDAGGGPLGTDDAFVLRANERSSLRDDCVILHPLPRVNELPVEWDDHPGFLVWKQVRNGMWIRAALFATLFAADDEVLARARRLGLLT